jgi:hypothetical protein
MDKTRKTARRIIGSILTALLMASLGLLVPTAASAVICGPGGCGPYRIDYVFAGGGTAAVSYSHQYQWIVDATHGAQRGYRQQNGYVKMTVTDGNYGSAVTATFCYFPQWPCVGTYSNGVQGEPFWAELDYNSDCTHVTPHDGDYETPMWAYYLTGVALTTVGDRGGATIFSAKYNAFGVGCGVV